MIATSGRVPVVIALVVLMAGASWAQDSDWFKQSGFTVMESVGSDQLGYVLIGTNDTGAFQLLSKGNWYREAFRLDAIGSEQVKVTTKDQNVAAIPILHRNVPPDIFLLALANLFQRSVVIGCQTDSLKSVTPELMTNPAKLAEFCQQEGLDLRVFEDCMVIRKGRFPADIKAFASTAPQVACALNVQRGSMGDVAQALAKVSGKIVNPTGSFTGNLSVRSFGLSPEAVAHYVGMCVDGGLKVEEPKPEAKAAAAPAPAKAVTARDRFKELMRGGKYLAAARLAQEIVKKHPAKAAGYNYYGLALWKLGHRQTAVKAWEKALRLEPANQYAQQVLRKVRSSARLAKATAKASAAKTL